MNVGRSAVRTADAERPTGLDEKSKGGVRIGEIPDGLNQRLGKGSCVAVRVHARIVA